MRLNAISLALCCALPALAQYTAQRTGDVVRLEDAKSQTVVSIAVAVGNEAFEMKVHGQEILQFPYASVADFKARPRLSGVPFLAPFANRLDEQAFYANGKKYPFNMTLGNIRGNIPSHGFLTTTDQWQVVEVKSDGNSAWVTSRLEFYRHPEWMAQFPFAHTIEMTHRLKDGVLEVSTKIQNLSTDPMPVSIGFHPYLQLTDSPREDWTIGIGARQQWLLNSDKVPTGETQPIEKYLTDPQAAALKDYDLDHVFTDLIRDPQGRAVMYVKGRSQKIEVVYGQNFKAAVVYSPKPRVPAAAAPAPVPGRGPVASSNFICFEPMVAISDAMNLAQKGLYKELQSVAPGQTWQESFWIRPSGF